MAARRLQKLRGDQLLSEAPETESSDEEVERPYQPFNAFDLLGEEQEVSIPSDAVFLRPAVLLVEGDSQLASSFHTGLC